MNSHHITLNCHSNAELNAYESLAVISRMYEGRTDYRIIGGQMVNLLLAAYPVPETRARATQDADTAIEEIELLYIADDVLAQEGFKRVDGGAFEKGVKGSSNYQEINYLKSIFSSKPGIRPISIDGDKPRQIDASPELSIVMQSSDYITVHATVIAPEPGTNFEFSVVLPSVELAILLKTDAVISRQYLDKDLKDLLTLFKIYDYHTRNLEWKYNDPKITGRRKDTVLKLHRISKYLRRHNNVNFSSSQASHLRRLIMFHVTDLEPLPQN